MRSLRSPESQSFAPWREGRPPRRVLLVRLHALGDVALTLPPSRALRESLPEAQIDFLTLSVHAPLLRSARLFDHVLELPPPTDPPGRFVTAVRWGLLLRSRKYDVVIDLQRNWVTRIVRRIASPMAWGEFDRFSPKPASERVLEAMVNSGFVELAPSAVTLPPELKNESLQLLRDQGYDDRKKLIVLNPAGLWETRNWPLENYVALARLWLNIEAVQFLMLGTGRILGKSAAISRSLGPHVINLAGKTSLEMAMGALSWTTGVITEDSGLMHIAWAMGIPIVALFGSSRHIWSAPTGPKARTLHSGDLICGQCMEPHCRYGDVHCLVRRTPEEVLTVALELLSHSARVIA